MIEPGEEFTYKLSLMRPGTFVYHSHLDDINQLTKGLFGAMIVLGENETYDPQTDHSYVLSWKSPNPTSAELLDLNGWKEVPVQHAKAGDAHRLRLINIGPAGNGSIKVEKDGKVVPIRGLAKDGADFPEWQRQMMEKSPRVFVGETADFEFKPMEPGNYALHVDYMGAIWTQTWIVE